MAACHSSTNAAARFEHLCACIDIGLAQHVLHVGRSAGASDQAQVVTWEVLVALAALIILHQK